MHVLLEDGRLPRWRELGWRVRWILAWGKLRRLYLLCLRPEYVAESLKRRVGSCHRTGACCNLSFPCPLLSWLGRLPLCRAYGRRPRTCSIFPIDERDLRDRDLVNPTESCGFSFIAAGEVREEEETRRQAELAFHV